MNIKPKLISAADLPRLRELAERVQRGLSAVSQAEVQDAAFALAPLLNTIDVLRAALAEASPWLDPQAEKFPPFKPNYKSALGRVFLQVRTALCQLELPDGLPDIVDVDGRVDSQGIQFLGKAYRQPDGTWRCLANVGGALCIVEADVTPEAAK